MFNYGISFVHFSVRAFVNVVDWRDNGYLKQTCQSFGKLYQAFIAFCESCKDQIDGTNNIYHRFRCILS